MKHLPSIPGLATLGIARCWVCAWVICLVAIFLSLFLPAPIRATDLPHTDGTNCSSCHMVHKALGGAYLNVVSGNANLCQSCHVAGGSASTKALSNSMQAMPWPGLPAAYATGTGNSHRWDSGVAGYVKFVGGAATASTGTVTSSGTFNGPYAKTYTLTIATSGSVGTAKFNWSATTPGGGSGSGTNLVTGTNVLLDQGVSANFTDGAGTSFQANDSWYIFVRTNLRSPTNVAMQPYLTNGQMMCSTCHNPHSQIKTPFDSTAPAYVSGSGAGRHFMIDDNNTDQLCVDCHAPRNVTTSGSGSHPVGVTIPVDAYHKAPSLLPLTSSTNAALNNNVSCETCHDIHFGTENDGSLVRLTDRRAFCADCHTLADTTTPGAHLSSGSSALWPGGQYGSATTGTSTFPMITDTTLRGSCANCHQTHGWPVAATALTSGTTYSKLLVDMDPYLCFTCHDSNGPAGKNVQTDFAKLRHHPVGANEQITGRPATSCTSCHNPHKAVAGAHVLTGTATSTRNQASNVLKGVDGVSVNFAYSGTANFQAVPAAAYTYIPKSTGVTYEYQICFKCHTSYAFGANPPPAGLSPVYITGTGAAISTGSATFTNGSATVTGTGTAWAAGMVGMWVAPAANNPSAACRITAVASGTSMTISPVYSGTTSTRVAYVMTSETDVGQEFSIYNRSAHPIFSGTGTVTGKGLNGYPNSLTPRPLVGGTASSSQLKAPWNVNVGEQTMMCSDCHISDSSAPAVQGPHGSANQFLLSGTNGKNWPNVTLANFNTSFCANCHNQGTVTPHTEGNHRTSSIYCYTCHIVVPHGGKVSRLVATSGTGMPTRYAYNNTLSNAKITVFRKASSYGQNGYCQTSCYHGSAVTTNPESW